MDFDKLAELSHGVDDEVKGQRGPLSAKSGHEPLGEAALANSETLNTNCPGRTATCRQKYL